jgi:hypothetical protein
MNGSGDLTTRDVSFKGKYLFANVATTEPGILGVVLDQEDLFADLICDGLHLAPEAVRLWFKAKGPKKGILIGFAGGNRHAGWNLYAGTDRNPLGRSYLYN